MGNDQMICYCDNVTNGEIIAAMEQGAKTLQDIKRMTGACCSCRCAELNPSGKCCAQDIAAVMREYLLSKKITLSRYETFLYNEYNFQMLVIVKVF